VAEVIDDEETNVSGQAMDEEEEQPFNEID